MISIPTNEFSTINPQSWARALSTALRMIQFWFITAIIVIFWCGMFLWHFAQLCWKEFSLASWYPRFICLWIHWEEQKQQISKNHERKITGKTMKSDGMFCSLFSCKLFMGIPGAGAELDGRGQFWRSGKQRAFCFLIRIAMSYHTGWNSLRNFLGLAFEEMQLLELFFPLRVIVEMRARHYDGRTMENCWILKHELWFLGVRVFRNVTIEI